MGRKISLCQQKELCVLLAVMPYSVPCSVVGTNKMTNKALVHYLGMMVAAATIPAMSNSMMHNGLIGGRGKK